MSNDLLTRIQIAIYLIAAVVLCVVVGFNADPTSPVFAVAVSALGSLIILAIPSVITHAGMLRLAFESRFRYSKEDIRFSMSYLIRIPLDKKYVLIMHPRFGKFQPVGGVYMKLKGFAAIKAELEIKEDDKISHANNPDDDLRVYVPGRNAKRFVKWFRERRGRESGAWREFYQELIESGLVDGAAFPYALFGWVRRHETGIQYCDDYECNEYKSAEIFEVELNPAQEQALRDALAKHPDKLGLFSMSEIKTRGITEADDAATISDTARWLK